MELYSTEHRGWLKTLLTWPSLDHCGLGALHKGYPRSELWTVKLLAFKMAKMPKPHSHINQTNSMVHRGRPKNLTPIGPLWCTLYSGGWCTMAALMIIHQAMPMLRFTESQIKQTNNSAQRVAKTQSHLTPVGPLCGGCALWLLWWWYIKPCQRWDLPQLPADFSLWVKKSPKAPSSGA